MSTGFWEDVDKSVPAGDYLLRIILAKFAMNAASAPTIAATYEVISADDAANKEAVGARVFETFTFTKEAAFRFKRFSGATGIALPPTIDRASLEDVAKQIIGVEVRVRIVVEEWRGELRTRVAAYLLPKAEGEVAT